VNDLRKLVSLAVLIAVVLSMGVLAACGGSDDSASSGGGDATAAGGGGDEGGSGEEPIKAAVLLNGKADDQTWNTSMDDSIKRAAESANIEIVANLESITPADGARATREVIEQGGAQMVILHASALDQSTKEVAAEHPEVCFVQAFGTEEPGPNVSYYVDNATGVNYLAGMVAAGVSTSGTLGVVGGVDLTEIVASVDAFEQGAKAVNPDAKVLVTWVGDFEDPLKGKEAGLAQIEQGADVVYAFGDGTGLGTVEAAKEKNVPIIGAWFDQYSLAPELMVTSFVSDWEPLLKDQAAKFREGGGEACSLGTWVADLNNGGTLLAPYHDWEDKVPADVKEKVDAAREQIMAGTLDPVTGQSS